MLPQQHGESQRRRVRLGDPGDHLEALSVNWMRMSEAEPQAQCGASRTLSGTKSLAQARLFQALCQYYSI